MTHQQPTYGSIADVPGAMTDEPLPNRHDVPKGATATSSIINLLNTIVGAGILAMPFAYKSNGILLGTIIILLSGVTAGFGLYLQALSSQYVPHGHASFFAVAKKTYPSLAVVFDIAIAIKCFGVGVSYIIIVGDLMPQIAESFGATHEVLLHRQFWVALSFGIVGPLSFLRKLDSLKYTSVVALVSVGYLIIIVIGHFLVGDTSSQKGPVKVLAPESASAVLSALPVIVFAFTCHQNMFSVLNELPSYNEKQVRSVIGVSVLSSGLMYIVVGLCGYLSFGDNVGGNIISEYHYSIFSTIGRIAIVVLVIFSYPLQCHPCRASCNHVLHSLQTGWGAHKFTSLPSEEEEAEAVEGEVDEHGNVQVPLENKTFLILTVLILFLSLIVALSVHSLELMLAFVGATGSTSISFILPGVFGYSLLTRSKVESGNYLSKRDTFIRFGSLALTTWGVLVAVVCLSINIWGLIRARS